MFSVEKKDAIEYGWTVLVCAAPELDMMTDVLTPGSTGHSQ